MVPVAMVWTLVVVVTRGEALELLVASHVPTPAAATTTTTAPTMVLLLLNHRLRSDPTFASLAVSPSPTPMAADPVRTALPRPNGRRDHPTGRTCTPVNSHL